MLIIRPGRLLRVQQMNHIRHALFVILAVASFELIAQGQSRDWRVYSPTDDRFTVEVPSASRFVKTSESKNETNPASDQKDSLDTYVTVYEDASSGQYSKFKVVVVNGKAPIFKSLSGASFSRI